MSNSVPAQFSGFAAYGPETWNETHLVHYEPKKFLPEDITIKIKACGVCGSDCHQIKGNWGPHPRSDLVVGHEIIGEVVEVGSAVTKHKLGDIVGVGAQSNSCGECDRCLSNNEQYCPKHVFTYGTVDFKADNYVTQGGYASHIRLNAHYAASIPTNLDINAAAPLLCGGLTVYSPIVRNAGYDLSNKTIGIVGIGGLGSMAIQIAKALGAKKIYAFSRSDTKKADALGLGADELIATKEKPFWFKEHFNEFDFILNCANSGKGANLDPYILVLKLSGIFVNVSAPPVNEKLQFSAFPMISNGGTVKASAIGSMKEADELLKLFADKGLSPWIEKIPISAKGVNQVLTRINDSNVRYRFVLTDFENAFN
ncbi:alcohol dehydrogenase, class V [Scheffersomyces coipomensis]|uniref:alcohol dehydrogenase, class V n=1 Tax=Scheffersomyces coipomensis TaxID=1788519 RepID=UPI00315C90ED